MDRQLKQWQSGVEQLWSATVPDYRDAARLLAEMARAADDPALRQAAAQALPSLRDASLGGTGGGSKELAQRRLSVVRDILHTLTAPQFGKRGNTPVRLTPEEHHRRLLGLPLGRRLAAPEIHQAYKRAAKSAHPDGGGNAHEFQQLSAARDALMKQR